MDSHSLYSFATAPGHGREEKQHYFKIYRPGRRRRRKRRAEIIWLSLLYFEVAGVVDGTLIAKQEVQIQSKEV